MSNDLRSRPFFVLTLTRSGSTWFLSLLNGQEGVAAYEELFLPAAVPEKYAWVASGSPDRFFVRRKAMAGPRPRKLWRYLAEVERSAADRPFVGFKLMLGQLRALPELLPILALRRYRMVALVRDNIFEGAVSRVVLDLTGDAQSRSDAPQDRKLDLPTDALIAEMRKRRLGLRMLHALQRTWPAPSVLVRYDELVADQRGGIEKVLRVMGAQSEPRPVESPLKRRIQRPYHDLIANYDEVCEAARQAGLGSALPGGPAGQ